VESEYATLARFLYDASFALVPVMHDCFMVPVTKMVDSPYGIRIGY